MRSIPISSCVPFSRRNDHFLCSGVPAVSSGDFQLKAIMNEVDETLKRIQAHKGVIGTIVINNDGIPIRTSLDNSTTVQYAGLLCSLTQKARNSVRDLDPSNDLTFLRIRSKKNEIMCAPSNDYLFVVIQHTDASQV